MSYTCAFVFYEVLHMESEWDWINKRKVLRRKVKFRKKNVVNN